MALRVGDTGRAASRGLRSLCSPAGLRGAGRELAWLAAHAALYPLGFRPERPDRRRPAPGRRPVAQHRGLLAHDAAAAATPVLLVHGMVDNRSIFTLLRRSLRRCGFGQVGTVNYSVFTSDVRAAARAWARRWSGSASRPGTTGCTWSRTRSAAWSPATTSSGRAAMPACTPWSPSAPHTAAPRRRRCCRCGCAGSCAQTRT